MAVDLDNTFKYCTPKFVYIRDWKLGILKYVIMLLIFVYVVVYNICIACTHLKPHHAQGFGTIAMEHPVMNCDPLDKKCKADFHNIAKLKYCKQSQKSRRLDGNESARELEDDKESDVKIGELMYSPRECRYFDNWRFRWEAAPPSERFIPTRFRHVVQKINKDCYNPEIHSDAELHGKTKYRCKSPWVTTKDEDYYIADIENYKIKLSHTFNSPMIGKHGVSTDYQGLFAACKSNHPKDLSECKRAKVPHTSGNIAPEDVTGLSTAADIGMSSLKGTKDGEDEIQFGEFLRATPVAQKYKIKSDVLDVRLPDSFGHQGKTLREQGGIILLDVDYANDGKLRPGFPGSPDSLAIKPITYTYRPYFVPSTKNSHYQLIQESDHADKRVIDVWYGVTIKMQFNGKLVAYSNAGLLAGLTSGLVLLTMASTIVSALASFVLPLKEKYTNLMYQMSEDFSNYKVLRHELLDDGASKWNDKLSVYASGTKLQNCVEASSGAIKSDVSWDSGPIANNKQMIELFTLMETRLNRLDGMDLRLIHDGITYPEGLKNKMGLAYQSLEKNYYENEAGLTEGDKGKLSFPKE